MGSSVGCFLRSVKDVRKGIVRPTDKKIKHQRGRTAFSSSVSVFISRLFKGFGVKNL